MKQIIPKVTLFIVQWSLSLAFDPFIQFIPVDPCSVCNENDKNIKQSDVSDECNDAVGAWALLSGIKFPEECDDNEGTTVSAKCKYFVFSELNCIDNTYADPCSVCNENDRNIKQAGVSDKCYEEVNTWVELHGSNIPASEECSDNESGSTVSAKCKDTVFSMFKCSIKPFEDDYDSKFKYSNDIILQTTK